ncbi:MAG: Uma2 family endonuclease [Saprospiraceae bacterium]|jgi:hypothetical protein|nr:Uma2 family endonuclease [Saprospiraceae bacterium]
MTTTAAPAPAPVAKQPARRAALKKALVYEIVDGHPIYYKGYKQVLSGAKTREEIMGDSSLQAWLKLRIAMLLFQQLQTKGYEVTTGEQGLRIGKRHRRDADIAIFRRENFSLSPRYAHFPPDAVIEIDVDADTENASEMEYIFRKVADYFAFGLLKVVWVFTQEQRILVFSPDQPPVTLTWQQDVDVITGASFNISKMLAESGLTIEV